MRALAIVAAAVGLALVAAGPATAAPAAAPPADAYGAFRLDLVDPRVAYFDGPIEEHAADDFFALVRSHPDIALLVLDSPGGLTEEARIISELVYALGIDTFVPEGAGCYSACSTMFFGGADRVAVGELGVHRSFSDERFEHPDEISLLLGFTLESWMHYGIPLDAVLATYRTPNEDIHVFTADEIARINRGSIASLNAISDDLLARIAATSGVRFVALDRDFDIEDEFRGLLAWERTGPADDPAVTATIAVAAAGLEVTLEIARIGDDGATAIDVTFRPQSGQVVEYIERLSVDTASGEIVDFIGSAHATGENTFRIVLPARWSDRNDELLFDHSGFNLIFSYADGSGGALLIDRLSSAQAIFDEVAAAWGRIPPDPAAQTSAVLMLPPDPPKVEAALIAQGSATWSFDAASGRAVVTFRFPGEDFWSRVAIVRTGGSLKVSASDRSYPDSFLHGGLVALDGITIKADPAGNPLPLPVVVLGRGLSLELVGADEETFADANWVELVFANADGTTATISVDLGPGADAALARLFGENADAP